MSSDTKYEPGLYTDEKRGERWRFDGENWSQTSGSLNRAYVRGEEPRKQPTLEDLRYTGPNVTPEERDAAIEILNEYVAEIGKSWEVDESDLEDEFDYEPYDESARD